MAIKISQTEGVLELTMNNPPVNALNIKDAYEMAEILESCTSSPPIIGSPQAHVVILTAEGKGFCAGVDIKEIQAMEGNAGILRANDSCFRLFRAIYECAVPVVVAVNDFCLGTGIGIAGSADMVIATEGAQFGLPEVDNGALGAATHLRRLVPEKRARQMLYTCEMAGADELAGYGSIYKVVAPDRLMDTAREIASEIATKSLAVIRRAKRSLNGIDTISGAGPVESYRYEQGYTFELNLMGEGDKAREAFLKGERKKNGGNQDKRGKRDEEEKEKKGEA